MDEIIIQYNFPVDNDSIDRIFDYLRNINVLFHPKIDIDSMFDITFFHVEKQISSFEYFILVDRNIFTDIISIIKNIKSKGQTLVSSIMFFCKYNQIAIEPNISLYEIGSIHGNEIANEEFAYFHKAEKCINPQTWADLSLGEIDNISHLSLPQCTLNENDDYTTSLKHYNYNYIGCLKLCDLILDSKINNEDKIIQFYEWMYNDYLFVATLTVSSHLMLSGKIKNFKNINSNDTIKVIAGVKNFVWDLTYLTYWQEKMKVETINDDIYLFATNDNALKTIIPYLYTKDSDDNYNDLILNSIKNTWGNKSAKKIAELYLNLIARKNSPARKRFNNFDSSYIELLEKKLIESISIKIKER